MRWLAASLVYTFIDSRIWWLTHFMICKWLVWKCGPPGKYTLQYYNMRGAAPSGARGGGERMRGAARFTWRAAHGRINNNSATEHAGKISPQIASNKRKRLRRIRMLTTTGPHRLTQNWINTTRRLQMLATFRLKLRQTKGHHLGDWERWQLSVRIGLHNTV